MQLKRASTLLPVLFVTSLAATATLAGCADDDDASEPDLSLDDAEIAELEARADRLIAAGVPGVVAVARVDDQIVRVARGVSDRTTGAPMTIDARMRVASIAKSVLSAVIFQLVDEGEVALDDTVDELLPGMVTSNGHATLEDLLRLQSGIFDFARDERHMAPYYAGDFEYTWSPEGLVALSNEHPPSFEPGAGWEYSNTNYTLVGLIIQKVTGKSLAAAIDERIFTPLGMESSTMAMDSHMDAPFSHGYMYGLGDPIDVTGISASHVFGSGNLVSTADDLVTFYRALAAGEVVDPDRLEKMFSLNPASPNQRYAMGLWRFDHAALFPCDRFVGHDGGIAGFDTVSYTSIDGRRQFTLVATSFTPEEKVGDETAQQAWLDVVGGFACGPTS